MTQSSFPRRALRVALLTGGAFAALQGGAVLAQKVEIKPQVLTRLTGQSATDELLGEYPGRFLRTAPVVGADGRIYAPTPGTAPGGYSSVGRILSVALDGTGYKNVEYSTAIPYVLSPMVRSAAGSIYGSANTSAFSIGADGVPTVVTPRDTAGATVTPGTFQSGIAGDAQGNVYYATRVSTSPRVYRLNTAKQFELLADFSRDAYVVKTTTVIPRISTYLMGENTVALAYSDNEAALYGVTGDSSGRGVSGVAATIPGDIAAGTLYRIKASGFKADGSSPIELLHTFAKTRDGAPLQVAYRFPGLTVVGDWIYGTTTRNDSANSTSLSDALDGRVWRVHKDCVSTADNNCMQVVHRFDNAGVPVVAGGGSVPIGNIVVAADGNVYGTTLLNGARMNKAGNRPLGGGTLYRIENAQAANLADVKYVALHNFDIAADGAFPSGLALGGKANGVQKLYGVAEAGGMVTDALTPDDGAYGSGNGTLFSVDVALPAATIDAFAVSSSAASSIPDGSKITLTWKSTGAAQCTASGSWSGAKQASGSEEIGPLSYREAGYDYGLVCTSADGAVSPVSTVKVTVAQAVVPPTESGGGGGGAFSLLGGLLLMLGAAGRGLLATRKSRA